ncbi:MAG TPA: globin domain-containing protein [Streptosporangiaceae bacterium]|nr:globin domain-containing protein [Streptosporangiaceae bacterium]
MTRGPGVSYGGRAPGPATAAADAARPSRRNGADPRHGTPPLAMATARGTQTLRESLSECVPQSQKLMAYFFASLFVRRPELRRMFPPALGAHGQRVFSTLVRYAWTADTPEALAGWLSELARDHRKFGVIESHYEPFCDVLLTAVRAFSVPAWSPETEAAWEDALVHIAAIMTEATREAADEPAWWLAEVTGHERRGPDVAVLTLRPGPPLDYLPGQHVSVQVPQWPRTWREYSVANAPSPDGLLRLHVRAIAGGLVSNVLVQQSQPGDTVLLGRARGNVTADTVGTDKVVCLAGGTGLSQVKAIAQALTGPDHGSAGTAAARRPQVQLFVGARREADLYDLADLRCLERSSANLTVVPVVSDEPDYPGLRGTLADVAGQLPAATPHVIISGPAGMVAETAARASARAPGALIRFDPPTVTGSISSPA